MSYKHNIAIALGCVVCGALGFGIHNYWSWQVAQNNLEPVHKKVVKEKYHIIPLAFKKLPFPDYPTKNFPDPMYNNALGSRNSNYQDSSVFDKNFRNKDSFNAQNNDNYNNNLSDKNDISSQNNALEYRLNQAINDSNESYDPSNNSSDLNYTIFDLPENLKHQIPKFIYGSHVYSSKTADRFITLNNQKYHEGDQPFGILKVIKIEPNFTVFRMDKITFSLSSLTDWNGAGN